MTNDNPKIDISEHLGLVHLCCQRFRKRGVEYDEIFQCGCLGLAKAAKNFDTKKGVKFSTYAIPVILGEIKTFFRDNTSIKFSRSLKELSAKIKKYQEDFIKDYFRKPTINEISSALNLQTDQILEALEISKPVVSLDDLEETRQELPNFSIEEDISMKLSVFNVFKTFAPLDKSIIYLRFFKCQTQCEIAKKLGMTQVQVSRREKALIRLLREKLS